MVEQKMHGAGIEAPQEKINIEDNTDGRAGESKIEEWSTHFEIIDRKLEEIKNKLSFLKNYKGYGGMSEKEKIAFFFDAPEGMQGINDKLDVIDKKLQEKVDCINKTPDN